MSEKKHLKISIIELSCYVVFGGLALWGLVYTVLGLFAAYLPIPDTSNPIKQADNTIRQLFGLGFFGWGLILFGVFMCAIVVTLMIFAKGTDRDYEKNQRRAARLQRNKVVDATVEEQK